jgi:AcrR family transcriptional regulator
MRPHAYHHGHLRSALITAALTLVSSEGIKALTLREVARRAGVSHAALYHHFADKAGLLAAVAEEGFRKMHEEMTVLCANAGPDPYPRLRAIGVGYVRFAASHPAHFRVMFSPDVGSSETLQEKSRATLKLLTDGLAAFGADEAHVAAMAVAAWSLVHGLSVLWIDGQLDFAKTDEMTIERMAEMCADVLSLGTARHVVAGKSPKRKSGRASRPSKLKDRP